MDVDAATAVVASFIGVIGICAGVRAGLDLLSRA